MNSASNKSISLSSKGPIKTTKYFLAYDGTPLKSAPAQWYRILLYTIIRPKYIQNLSQFLSSIQLIKLQIYIIII